MPWTWVRPADPDVLAGRPLLDVGTGDGQSVAALTGLRGVVVGVDEEADALRAARLSGVERLVRARAAQLPVREGAVAVVLAADLLHHVPAQALQELLTEFRRVLVAGGHLVAWWYQQPGRGGPGDPRYPRTLDEVLPALRRAGFAAVSALELDQVSGPATTGVLAS